MTELGKQVLAAQPFSSFLGTELVTLSEEYAELHLILRAEFFQQNGFAHGGILSYLADNALTFAGGAALGGGSAVTAEYKINYLRPAIGKMLVAKAAVVGIGKNQAVVRCDIFALTDEDQKLCAIAQGTIARTDAISSRRILRIQPS